MRGGSAGAVLVLRALGLGDLLTAVPALRSLRRWARAAHPGAELVLACPRVLAALLDLADLDLPGVGRLPVVDRVLALDATRSSAGLRALPAAWRATGHEPPLVAVNLHGRGPASHRALAALAPARLVGFASAEAGVAGPAWEPAGHEPEHERERWCRLVTTALGCDADPRDLLLARPTAGPSVGGAVVVHPGAAYPARRWPPDRWAAVARGIADAGHRVVLSGGPDEVTLAEEVRRLAGLSPDTVVAGRTDLGGLAALVAAASLVVCGDTGVAHLASAYRTPSVVLFGPTSPARWGPPRDGPHTVLRHGGADERDPAADAPDPALLQITVEEVLGAVRLRSGGRTTPASA